MNIRINELKDRLKTHLKKRIDFDENDLVLFSLPYSVNVTGEGIENYLPGFVNFSLDRIFTIAYLGSLSAKSTIYDYNNSRVYEISPEGNHYPPDQFGYLLCKTVEASFKQNQIKNGIIGAVFDDYHSSSLSSPALKFTSVVIALFNSNTTEMTHAVFSSVLKEADSSLLGININMNEVPGVKENIEKNDITSQEKFSWSDFNELKLLRVSFEKKRPGYEHDSKFSKNLNKAHDLLKVLMASARVRSVAEFSSDQINAFARRVPAEQKAVVDYLYRESVLTRECIDSLRTKNFENFIATVNESGLNLVDLGTVNPEIVKLFNSFKNNDRLVALKISPHSSAINCFIRESDEDTVKDEFKRIISALFPHESGKINIYSDSITGIYIYSRN